MATIYTPAGVVNEPLKAPAAKRGMRTELLTTWEQVHSLSAEWDTLLQQSVSNSIFLRWEWIASWSQVVGKQVQPFVVTVRGDGGKLLGIAPFYVARYRFLGIVLYRLLRVMGDYPTGGEYGALIANRDCQLAVWESLAKTLSEYSHRWDCIWMPNTSGWDGAADSLAAIFNKLGMRVDKRTCDFGYFDLPKSWDAYLKSLAPRIRTQRRQEEKKLTSQPSAEIVRCTSQKDIPEFLEALFDLHHRRWRIAGDEGSFKRKPNEAEFYRSFIPKALAQGWLRLFGLRIDGVLKAVQIGYVYEGVFYQLQEGFDPDAFKGVGNALRTAVIRNCIEEGLKGYDFLGVMTEHKHRWGAQERLGWNLFVGKRSLKNDVLFAGKIWPTGRYFRPTEDLGGLHKSNSVARLAKMILSPALRWPTA